MDADQFVSPILLSNGTYLIHDDDDNVHVETGTSLLIQGDTISSIHPDIKPRSHYVSFDCTGKIICPGFIDTHHHVWQTQLKGRHSDDTLLDYHPKGKPKCTAASRLLSNMTNQRCRQPAIL
jgi:cytosine/adenosine deaminase-related metal-dependent hydrolase